MAENESFNQKIIFASEAKDKWYDTECLPKIQDQYRIHLSCVRNILENLVKRGLVLSDPYKNETKISKIVLPSTEPFNDNERATEIGIRLGMYETMIDFVCNYMRFSVEQLKVEKIKKLLELNQVFQWTNLSMNSTVSNTRNLAHLINDLKTNADQLLQSMIKDCLHKTNLAITEIDKVLKELAEYQKERYKVEVRRNVLENPALDKTKAYASAGDMLGEIRRVFPQSMAGRPFNSDFINQIVQEEVGPDKAKLQEGLLKLMEVKDTTKPVQENRVDVHAILMEAMRVMGTTHDHYKIIYDKINANHEVLQTEKNTFKEKIKMFFRNLLGLAEPSVDYEVNILDKKTGGKKKEIVHFAEFSSNLLKRVKIYSAFSVKEAPGWQKINQQKDEAILEYLNKQFIENNHLFALLFALDEFFKTAASSENRPKIKGLSMELTAVKNIIVKVNQLRSDYSSYVEEAEQMKRLGI